MSRHPSSTDLPRSPTMRRPNGLSTKGCGRGHISWSRVEPRRTDRPAPSSTAPLTHLEMNKHKRSRPQRGRVELPETGVEPARPYGHKHLKLARLPIPPPGRLIPGESTPTSMEVNLAPRFAVSRPFDPWFESQTGGACTDLNPICPATKNRGGEPPPAAPCTSGNLGTSLRINQ